MGSIHTTLSSLIQHTVRRESIVSQIYSPFSIEFLDAVKKDRRAVERRMRETHGDCMQKTHAWKSTPVSGTNQGIWIGSRSPEFALDVEPTDRQISSRLEARLRRHWDASLPALSLWTVLEALYKLTSAHGPMTDAVPQTVETLDTLTWGTAVRGGTLLEWANATSPDGIWMLSIARVNSQKGPSIE